MPYSRISSWIEHDQHAHPADRAFDEHAPASLLALVPGSNQSRNALDCIRHIRSTETMLPGELLGDTRTDLQLGHPNGRRHETTIGQTSPGNAVFYQSQRHTWASAPSPGTFCSEVGGHPLKRLHNNDWRAQKRRETRGTQQVDPVPSYGRPLACVLPLSPRRSWDRLTQTTPELEASPEDSLPRLSSSRFAEWTGAARLVRAQDLAQFTPHVQHCER